MTMKCDICGKEYSTLRSFSSHLRCAHSMKYKTYYDIYLKKPSDGICKICGKPTNFDRCQYRQYCSVKCMRNDKLIKNKIEQTCIDRYGGIGLQSNVLKNKAQNTCLAKYGVANPYQREYNKIKAHDKTYIRQPIIQFEKDHNCIWTRHLIEKYGYGWIYYLDLNYITYKSYKFVKQSDIHFIDEYYATLHKHFENDVLQYITTFYDGKIIRNTHKVITPYELDFYIPDLKLAIECNGTYWHSVEAGVYNKNYHLMKTELCESKGIRLIHVFESDWTTTDIRTVIKNAISQTEHVEDVTILDRSKDNLQLYLDNGYKVVKFTEPKPKDGRYTIFDCGEIILLKTD